MHWLSIDQKPSYFSTAGLRPAHRRKGDSNVSVREDYNQTRERYTILTSVPWSGRPEYARGRAPNGDEGGSQPNDAVAIDLAIDLEPDLIDVDDEPPPLESDDEPPPKCCVMFKGMPDGTILPGLRANNPSPEFMMVQVQEYGSYRTEDVVETLDWALPNAESSKESIVVLLDWYSGHRTAEVKDAISSKGHVLLFHGGGTTPFTQVNDTHFHALCQHYLEEIEMRYARKVREDDRAAGRIYKTPHYKREDVLSFCSTMWQMIPHKRIAESAYLQTGPGMPMTGPIERSDIAKELAKVWDELDPGELPGSMGTKIRDDAIAFVNEGWQKQWDCWLHAYRLIEEQDEEDAPVEEGLEGMEYAISDDEDDDNDDDDGHGGARARRRPPVHDVDGSPPDRASEGHHGQDGGGAGGDGHGGPPPSAGHAGDELQEVLEVADVAGDETPTAEAAMDLDDGDLFGPETGDEREQIVPGAVPAADAHAKVAVNREAPSQTTSGNQASAVAAPMPSVAVATAVVMDQALRGGNDLLLKHLRKSQDMSTRLDKEAAIPASQFLMKRMADEQSDAERRAKQLRAEERAAEAANLSKEQEISRNNMREAEARLQAMKLHVQQSREKEAARLAEEKAKRAALWLDEKFPCKLFLRLQAWYTRMSLDEKKNFKKLLKDRVGDKSFKRKLVIPNLWEGEANPQVFMKWAQFHDPDWPGAHWAKCSRDFRYIMESVQPPVSGLPPEVTGSLMQMFRAFLPQPQYIFEEQYSCRNLIHICFGVMERAFVYGVVLLSKWLGEDIFPLGIYGEWPNNELRQLPAKPAGGSQPIPVEDDKGAAASSGAGHSA